jgi:hypothetical protein
MNAHSCVRKCPLKNLDFDEGAVTHCTPHRDVSNTNKIDICSF